MVCEPHTLGVRHLAMEALFPRDVAAHANRAGAPAGWPQGRDADAYLLSVDNALS